MKIIVSCLVVLALVSSLLAFPPSPTSSGFDTPTALEIITIGDAPKTKKNSTAYLHAVRISDEEVLLLWKQSGKKNVIDITVPALAVPKLAPIIPGRTRQFFAYVSGSTKADMQWLAFELLPDGAR